MIAKTSGVFSWLPDQQLLRPLIMCRSVSFLCECESKSLQFKVSSLFLQNYPFFLLSGLFLFFSSLARYLVGSFSTLQFPVYSLIIVVSVICHRKIFINITCMLGIAAKTRHLIGKLSNLSPQFWCCNCHLWPASSIFSSVRLHVHLKLDMDWYFRLQNTF